MTYEKRPDTGTIAKSRNKTKDTHADYSGQINVAGVDYWLSGWLKTGPSGDKFLSLAVKVKQPIQLKAFDAAPAVGVDFDDDLPF